MSSIKNKYWFPHPANLRHDRRMKRAMRDLPGGVGYGAIVLTFEHLRCEPDYSYPLNDLDLLADEFGISLPIMQTVIKNYGFFELIKNNKEEFFISPVLNELMLPYDEKKEKNKIAGKIGAQKKKLKQLQQLHLLSQLDSSQHMLNGCETNDEQNIEEKNRIKNIIKEKTLSIPDFQIFKNLIVDNYKNHILCNSPKGFTSEANISLNEIGYLHNEISKKDLSPNDAKSVWKWMFENQDKLILKETK